MKSVLVMTGFGLAVLAILACRSSTPPPVPAAPATMPEPPPIVEIVDKIEPEPPDRVLSSAELLLLKDELNLTRMPEEGVEYVTMSRAGPRRHLKLKQQKSEEAVGWPLLGTGPTEHRYYSRAGPRPVKREPPIAKQD
jgi:hypothetical protein